MDEGSDGGRIRVVTESPLNAETPLAALIDPIQEAGTFYIRSNFPTPAPTPGTYRLEVSDLDGEVRRLTLPILKGVMARTRTVTLECAGNGRTLLDPQPPGTAWTLGGTGTANFTGVPLASLLPDLGDAVEILFTGADHGHAEGWGDIHFQRSLPVEVLAQEPAPMVVWGMNGQDLPIEHGGPVRLVVPGWYAVASVKWLTRIELRSTPFEGCFQTDRYRYLVPGQDPSPVRRMRPRALALEIGGVALESDGPGLPRAARPLRVAAGVLRVEGIAWTGRGAVDLVELSRDGGASWTSAEVDRQPSPWVRTRWRADLEVSPGSSELIVRARDTAGRAQPLDSFWNELGYGNNEVQRIPLFAG